MQNLHDDPDTSNAANELMEAAARVSRGRHSTNRVVKIMQRLTGMLAEVLGAFASWLFAAAGENRHVPRDWR